MKPNNQPAIPRIPPKSQESQFRQPLDNQYIRAIMKDEFKNTSPRRRVRTTRNPNPADIREQAQKRGDAPHSAQEGQMNERPGP